jgi:hypothetical protein
MNQPSLEDECATFLRNVRIYLINRCTAQFHTKIRIFNGGVVTALKLEIFWRFFFLNQDSNDIPLKVDIHFDELMAAVSR